MDHLDHFLEDLNSLLEVQLHGASRSGDIGVLARRLDGHLVAAIGFTIADGKVAEIDIPG